MVALDLLTVRIPLSDDWVREAADLVNFNIENIPGVLPNAPWSRDSLISAERQFLDRTTILGLTEYMAKDYEQYLGEGLVRQFNGHWVTIDPTVLGLESGLPSARGVAYDGDSEHIDVVGSLPHMATKLQTGNFWASVFEVTEAVLSPTCQ